jgi:hypothetical protein
VRDLLDPGDLVGDPSVAIVMQARGACSQTGDLVAA